MSHTDAVADSFEGPTSKATFLGHPVGLFVLFFAEMWERFSYYGMRGLLKLYMVNYLFVTVRQGLQGGLFDESGNPEGVLGWPFIRNLLGTSSVADVQACVVPKVTALMGADPTLLVDAATKIAEQTCIASNHASVLYGWYTSLVYATPFFGGIIADRWLGQRKSVVVGGLLMALGHFVMASESSFFLALVLLILGNGAFKPNVSTQVGALYAPEDPRRDGAFTIFYMGINLGAFICNLVCGTLAAVYGWHYGFAAAGVGMVLGLLVYLWGQSYLSPEKPRPTPAQKQHDGGGLTGDEWKAVGALAVLCLLNVVFWAVYEQQGNTMQTWADEQTVWPVIAGFQIPSTWYQSFNPLIIVLFAPLLDMFWQWQAKRGTAPSSVSKMAIGSLILGLSFIVMIIGAQIVGGGKGSLFWPLACTFLVTIGELYLSPIGLSLVTKVSPAKIISMVMGLWLGSSALGNLLSGYIGIYYTVWEKWQFFLFLTVLGVGNALAMWAFNAPLRKIIGHHDVKPEAA